MAPRRAVVRRTNANTQLVSATIERRTAAQNGGRKQSIRLTVKAPPSKLRQALHQDDNSPRDDFDASGSEPPVRAPRSTRNINKVVDPDSDGLSEEDEQNGEEMEQDEDEDSEDEDEDDDDEQGGDDDAEGEDDDEIDAELLGAEDSEGDTPAPTVPSKASRDEPPRPLKITAKGTVTIKPPPPVKSVEQREKEVEGDLSDLDDDDDDDENDVDDQDEDEDEAEADSDEDMADVDEHGREISGTPDPSKLTRRQRATVDETMDDGSLLALSNEAQKKKYITAEEHATRRLEMARRRRDLSEKKNEEEKMDTINKLLKKPAGKRKTRAEIMAAAKAADGDGEDGHQAGSADPMFVRWVNNAQGSKIGIPRRWLEGPAAGPVLSQGWVPPPEVKLIEEVA